MTGRFMGILSSRKIVIEKEKIESILPHRGNMLLLDRVVVSKDTVRGELLIREDFCVGHEVAGGQPIFRAVDIPEVAAQLVGVFWGFQHPDYQNMVGVLNGIERLKVRKAIFPGDALVVEIERSKIRQKILGGPEQNTIKVILVAKEICIKVGKETRATVSSLKIAVLSSTQFFVSQK